MDSSEISVRCALRVRPLSTKENDEGCQTALFVVENEPQVYIHGTDKAFTYDFVYGPTSTNDEVYEKSVKPIISEIFKGFNVTILAYGQTGSGKTHSMGTTYDTSLKTSVKNGGIIPRSVSEIFSYINKQYESGDGLSGSLQYGVHVSFMELYKEQLYDLLGNGRKDDNILDLREDPKLGIKVVGQVLVPVKSMEQALKQLELGSKKRVTAATAMNNVSSRSHAIFTLTVECKQKSTIAKFNLVDLAGSERQAKTKASGERFNEGVDINRGLLALGNVICALGDLKKSEKAYVNYRDSKLTRLLQDSLGGNAHTLMIACVSPADSNIPETIGTLRYADRARMIKNKPIVNKELDPSLMAELIRLRQEVFRFQTEGSKHFHEFQTELKKNESLELRVKELHDQNMLLSSALLASQDELLHVKERFVLDEGASDRLKIKLDEVLSGENSNDAVDVNFMLQKFRENSRIQNDVEKSMVEHDQQRFNSFLGSGLPEKVDDTPGAAENNDTTHILKISELSERLMTLNKDILTKEKMAKDITGSEERIQEKQKEYIQKLNELEREEACLKKECDELSSENLKNIKTWKKLSVVSSDDKKISEDRRRRINELETQLAVLRKKIAQQQRSIRLNQANGDKIRQLGDDIRSMKAEKVKLMRQMKQDADKARAWKAQKEKQVAQLLSTEIRTKNQMCRMEKEFANRQNVLKRKFEQGEAANKKLKMIIEKREEAQKCRSNISKVNNSSNCERIRNVVSTELDIIMGYLEIVSSKDAILKDRANIVNQISAVENGVFHPVDKKQQIDALNTELELCNHQISNLQRQLLNIDQAEAKKAILDPLCTVSDAKVAIETLINRASQVYLEASATRCSLNEERNISKEALSGLTERENELKRVKEEISRLKLSHEENVIFLLQQAGQAGSLNEGDGGAIEFDKFQNSEIQRISAIHEELVKENESLKKALSTGVNKQKRKIFCQQALEGHRTTNNFLKVPVVIESPELNNEEDLEELENRDDDDDIKDPDWEMTPLMRRIKKVRESTIQHFSNDEVQDRLKRKASSGVFSRSNKRSMGGCMCKTSCGTMRCKCRKAQLNCYEDNCKCCQGEGLICSNKKLSVDASSEDHESRVLSNITNTNRNLFTTGNSSESVSSTEYTNDTGNTSELLSANTFNISPL